MGSRKDLVDATEFITEHRIVPIVSHVLDGLEKVRDRGIIGHPRIVEGTHISQGK